MWRVLLVYALLQTVAEVLPSITDVPWTQPQAMKWGGFVFIAFGLWLLFSWRSSRRGR